MTVDGLTTILSTFGPKETMNRLENEVKAKGLTVFAQATMRRALKLSA